ncbi:MAG: hypothetical protein M3Q98_10330 [Actinomycetota bacterium]|nr:hypothetical protein [Actinomycetota bacterium]
MATSGELSWGVARVAGEEAVGGKLRIDRGHLRFRPGKWQTPDPEAWSFEPSLAEISDVDFVERTLRGAGWAAFHRGLRIRTGDGSEATFYLSGRARHKLDEVVPNLRKLVTLDGGLSDPVPGMPTVKYADSAENATLSKSSEFSGWLRRYSWWIAAFGLATIWIPDLVRGLREGAGLWVLVYPGVFIAVAINMIAGRFVNVTIRNHPFVAILPVTSYLVGVSILALVLVPLYRLPISAGLAPLLFGIPAAGMAAIFLSPGQRRTWREARDNDNDKRRSRGA